MVDPKAVLRALVVGFRSLWVSLDKQFFEAAKIHFVVAAMMGFLGSVLSWVKNNAGELLIGVSVAASVASIALLMSEGRNRPARRVRRIVAVILSFSALACSIPGVYQTLRRVPSSDCVCLPQATYVALMKFGGASSPPDPRLVRDLLLLLKEDLIRSHRQSLTLRIELAVYDEQAQALRLISEYYIDGWPSSVVARVYAIPGHSPSGGTSVAGAAWKERRRICVDDGNASPIFHKFEDAADKMYRPSRSVLSTPVFRANHPDAVPYAVLSIASPEPNRFSQDDYQIIDAFAVALGSYFDRGGE